MAQTGTSKLSHGWVFAISGVMLVTSLASFFSLIGYVDGADDLRRERDNKQGNHLARDVRITARDGVIRVEELHINVNTRVGVQGQNDEYDLNLAGDDCDD